MSFSVRIQTKRLRNNRPDASCARNAAARLRHWDCHFLMPFLVLFDFAQDWDKGPCLCAHATRGHARWIPACRAYRDSARTCGYAANNAERWLKNQPPASPTAMTAAWRFALKCKASHTFVWFWKRYQHREKWVEGVSFLYLSFLLLLLMLLLFFCWICMEPHAVASTPLITVWAQINDTSEAPPDATEVQWLVFKHSCVPETIFSV